MKRKLRIVCLIALLTVAVVVFTGCEKTPEEIDYANMPLDTRGQGGGAAGCEVPPDCAGYYSPTSLFDIDDVTLTFYFGTTHIGTNKYENSMIWEGLYFLSTKKPIGEKDNNQVEYCIKKNENFYLNKYLITDRYYTELITVPKELFIYEKGVIFFEVKGIDPGGIYPETVGSIAGTAFCYEVIGDKVILSIY